MAPEESIQAQTSQDAEKDALAAEEIDHPTTVRIGGLVEMGCQIAPRTGTVVSNRNTRRGLASAASST
jgi:hypothetical protein